MVKRYVTAAFATASAHAKTQKASSGTDVSSLDTSFCTAEHTPFELTGPCAKDDSEGNEYCGDNRKRDNDRKSFGLDGFNHCCISIEGIDFCGK